MIPTSASGVSGTLRKKERLTNNYSMKANKIIETVSDVSGIPIERMKSGDRKREAVCARHVAMYLIREITGEPYRVTSERMNQNRMSAKHAYHYVSDQLEIGQTDTTFIYNQAKELI